MLRIFIVVLCALILSGCGQYGGLYLPTKQSAHSLQDKTDGNARIASTVQKGKA